MSIRHERFFAKTSHIQCCLTLSERTNDFSMNYEVLQKLGSLQGARSKIW